MGEEIYDANGNPILDENGLPMTTHTFTGSGGVTMKDYSKSENKTGNKSKTETKDLDTAKVDEFVKKYGVTTPEYRGSQWADLLKREEETRRRKIRSNLDQQDLERRRGRMLAWTNAMGALGQVGGLGYAPVAKQNGAVMNSFDKLDALRREGDGLYSEDGSQWIRKAMVNEDAERAKIEAQNARTNASVAQTAANIYSQKSTQESSGSTNNVSGESKTDTTLNRDTIRYEDLVAKAYQNGIGRNPLALGDSSKGRYVTNDSEVKDIVAAIGRLSGGITSKTAESRDIDGGKYYAIVINPEKPDSKIWVPEKEAASYANSIDSIMSDINVGDQASASQKIMQLHERIKALEAVSKWQDENGVFHNYGFDAHYKGLIRKPVEKPAEENPKGSKVDALASGGNF